MNIIVKRPLVTEKAMSGTKENYYGFIVDAQASKQQIKKAVESLFPVNVVTVRTVLVKGKVKRVGKARRETRTSPYKKAFVKIKSGQTIDIVPTLPSEGVQS